MWNPFVINDKNYLVKCVSHPFIKVHVTDLKQIWSEQLSQDDLFNRFQELNPLFDTTCLTLDELVHKVLSLVTNIKPETSIELTEESNNAQVLELKCKVMEFWIKFKFYIAQVDEAMYFNEFTLPLMQTVQYLEMRQKNLLELLEKKDKEIQEHVLENGEISRKVLVTPKFDRNALIDGAPEELLVNVFGKSTVFFEMFSQKFGVIKYNASKKDELNRRKKIKVDKVN